MNRQCVACALGAAVVSLCAGGARGVDPFADHAAQYTSGVLPPEHAAYVNPSAALGSPSRFTGVGEFPGAVTPFNPAYQSSELVCIGVGGSLTLRFDEPVVNDPANPFGVDMLVFGNTGYQSDVDYGVTSGALFGSSTQGRIEVSQDGQAWFTVPGVQPDGLFPTLGYQDVTDPFSSPAGSVLTDFTKPVSPSFNAAGMSLAQIIGAYNGSGGGAGIDLASVGLSSASWVRITYLGTSGDLQVDAVSDVSAVPGPWGAAVLGAAAMARRRRRV